MSSAADFRLDVRRAIADNKNTFLIFLNLHLLFVDGNFHHTQHIEGVDVIVVV